MMVNVTVLRDIARGKALETRLGNPARNMSGITVELIYVCLAEVLDEAIKKAESLQGYQEGIHGEG